MTKATTQALCLNCGEIKLGALNPCPACEAEPTENFELDVVFSDHHMAVATLREFGEVVRAIRRACDEDELRLWSFVLYVSRHHPEVLDVELDPEEVARCAEVLERAAPPPVVMRESERPQPAPGQGPEGAQPLPGRGGEADVPRLEP